MIVVPGAEAKGKVSDFRGNCYLYFYAFMYDRDSFAINKRMNL